MLTPPCASSEVITDLSDISQKPIVLVCAADDRFALPLAVTVLSAVLNLKQPRAIALYILDGGIKPANRRRVERTLQDRNVTIHWCSVDSSLVSQFYISGHINAVAYYRLLIPEVLPQHLTKAIYLDSDLIVQGDISELWNLEIGDRYCLAVQDLGVPYVSSPNGLLNYRELGFAPEQKYFNSGVMCLNLTRWRSEQLAQVAMDYLQSHREFIRWHDQDALNAVCAGQWGELDPRWNRSITLYRYTSWQDSPYDEQTFNRLLQHPYIIHFTESGKPWTPGFQHPEKHLFFHYLDQSAWSGWQLRMRLTLSRVAAKLSQKLS